MTAKKPIVFLLLLLFILISPRGYSQSISEKIALIPSKHREKLEHLFHSLCTSEELLYVLLDEKPVFFTGYLCTPNWEDLVFSKCRFPFVSYWKIWKLYQSQFPSEKFLIAEEDNEFGHNIFVINKPLFIRVVRDNRRLFSDFLPDAAPETLLDRVEQGENFFSSVLKRNEILLGVLLGYGAQNAFTYFARLGKIPYQLTQRPQFFSQKLLPVCPICPLHFIAVESRETEQLQVHWEQARERVASIFTSSNGCFELVLSCLCESDADTRKP